VRLTLFEDSCVIWPRMPPPSVRSPAGGDAKLASMILLDLARLNKRRATFNSTTVSSVRTLSAKPGATALIRTRGPTDRSTSWFLLNRRSTNETGTPRPAEQGEEAGTTPSREEGGISQQGDAQQQAEFGRFQSSQEQEEHVFRLLPVHATYLQRFHIRYHHPLWTETHCGGIGLCHHRQTQLSC
jgi:hypothetical protein